MLQAGEKAPLFVGESTLGDVDLRGLVEAGGVVLFFYPKASTPG